MKYLFLDSFMVLKYCLKTSLQNSNFCKSCSKNIGCRLAVKGWVKRMFANPQRLEDRLSIKKMIFKSEDNNAWTRRSLIAVKLNKIKNIINNNKINLKLQSYFSKIVVFYYLAKRFNSLFYNYTFLHFIIIKVYDLTSVSL